MDRDTLIDFIPAYALGALDADECDAVEALLRADAEAQTLLVEYEAVAAHVALLAPPQAPPAHLAADLRARLAADRAARPAGPRGARGTARRRGWSMGMLAAAAAILVLAIAGALLQSDEAPRRASCHRNSVQADPGQEGASASRLSLTRQKRSLASWWSRRAAIAPCCADAPAGPEHGSGLPVVMIDQEGARTAAASSPRPTGEFHSAPFSAPVSAYQGPGVSSAAGQPYPDRPTGPRVQRAARFLERAGWQRMARTKTTARRMCGPAVRAPGGLLLLR